MDESSLRPLPQNCGARNASKHRRGARKYRGERHFSISRALAFFDFRDRTIINLWKVLKLIIAKPTREWTIRLPEIPKTEQRYFTPKETQDIREFRKEMASKLG